MLAPAALAAMASVVAAQMPPPERPSPGVWPDREYRWYYNPANHPTWLDGAAARALMVQAASRWEACGVRMTLLGETDREPGRIDGVNVVGWSLAVPPQLRGITVGHAREGKLIERDVAIRPDRLEFELAPALLQKVITHEFGHAVGLTHSSRCDDVMTLAADCPRTRPERLPLDLTGNDLARCHALYPPTTPAAATSPVVRRAD